MEKCRLASFPLPTAFAAPGKRRRPKKSLTPTCQRRGRAGGIDLASLFALPPRCRPPPLLSKLHRCTALSHTDAKTNPQGRRMEERTCVLFPLLCPSGQQTFHLTSAAATTAAAGRTHKLSIPLWSLLPLLPSHFHSTSDTHCSARLTNVKLKRKSCCCCKETPDFGMDHHLSLDYPRQLVSNKTARG